MKLFFFRRVLLCWLLLGVTSTLLLAFGSSALAQSADDNDASTGVWPSRQSVQQGTPASFDDAHAGDLSRQPAAWPAVGESLRAPREPQITDARRLPSSPEIADAWSRTPLAPEPLTELQRFVAASTGQLLPIFGSSLFTQRQARFGALDHAASPPDLVIGPDDELRIHVWGQVNYSASLRVSREGEVHLPQAGAVRVAGLPFSAVASHLRAALDRVYRNYELSVDLGQIHSVQIYVAGRARQPGEYTVSALSTLVDALFLSGGPSAAGSMRHVELRRAGRQITDFDLYALLVRGDKAGDAQLQDGDVIYIPAVGPQVALTGSVRQPGIYELRAGETAGCLLDAAGGRTALANGARLLIDRVDAGTRRAFQIAGNSAGLITPLADGDVVHVESITPDYHDTVTLRGSVASPGRFRWHPGMHLSELMPDRDALVARDYWWRRAQLGLPAPEFTPSIDALAPPTDNAAPRTLPLAAMEGHEAQRTPADARDDATLGKSPLVSAQPVQDDPDDAGQSRGAAQAPASFAHHTSAIAANGADKSPDAGLLSTPTAQTNWNYAVIERLNRETMSTELVPFDLGALVLRHDASQDLELQPGDVVTVFSQDNLSLPIAQQSKYVYLEGEFVRSGYYSVAPGETLRQLVQRAGGLTPNSYLYGADFTRKSTRRVEQRAYTDYVDRLEQELARNSITAGAAGGAQTSGSEHSQIESIDRLLISKLRGVQPTGRIVFNIRPDSGGSDEIPDLALENGDRLIMPSRPATIQVIGAVFNQNAFLARSDARVSDYLRLAGGTTRDADRGKSFILRANGSVTEAAFGQTLFGSGFDRQRLYPGDTVVVPEKGIHMGAMRSFLNWAQLFSQLSLGAAAIDVLR